MAFAALQVRKGLSLPNNPVTVAGLDHTADEGHTIISMFVYQTGGIVLCVCGFVITWVDHARPIFRHFDDGCFNSTFRSLTLFHFNFVFFFTTFFYYFLFFFYTR